MAACLVSTGGKVGGGVEGWAIWGCRGICEYVRVCVGLCLCVVRVCVCVCIIYHFGFIYIVFIISIHHAYPLCSTCMYPNVKRSERTLGLM